MKPDQERVRNLLTDTVTLLCKNGLQYQKELRVQGLLGITLDDTDVFVVHINEKFGDLIGGAINMREDDTDVGKLVMTDIGRDSEPEQYDSMVSEVGVKTTNHKRRSCDQADSSLDVGTSNQQILHRPIKRLMTSTPLSHRRSFQWKRRHVDTSTNRTGDQVPAIQDRDPTETETDLEVKVKVEDEGLPTDDKGNVSSCDPSASNVVHNAEAAYPGLSLNEIQSNYQHFEDILGMTDASADPGGGDPGSKRRVSQDPYSGAAVTSASDLTPAPGVGGPFITGVIRNESGVQDSMNSTWDSSQMSLHSTGYTPDGQSMLSSAPGCSTWNASQAAAASRLAISGTEQGSESTMVKYPCNNIQCEAIKQAITSHLVLPVVKCREHVNAFRVVWRLDSQQLDAVWRTIIQLRQLCDDLMQREADVMFFVSSISGVFTKATHKGFAPKRVFPAISYWVVRDGKADAKTSAALTRLLQMFVPTAEVKPITAQRRHDVTDCSFVSAPLFVVFKDHSSSYIRRRIEQSRQYLALPPVTHLPAKLIVDARSPYASHLTEAHRSLTQSGLLVDLVLRSELAEQMAQEPSSATDAE